MPNENEGKGGVDRVIFLKLGGSLVSDKTHKEALRSNILSQIADEVRRAIEAAPRTRLVLGHGSGSFGHVAAAKYGTRKGASTQEQWRGFCEVSDAAARLNRLVTGALLSAGVPAVSLQPSASAVCKDGKLIEMASGPIKAALSAGIVPVVYGDVAFDTMLGATIASTEEVFAHLAKELRPEWLLLAGETEGVYDQDGKVVGEITQESLPGLEDVLGGSRGTDVTGGMASKVHGMLDVIESLPDTKVRIFSGLVAGQIFGALLPRGNHSGVSRGSLDIHPPIGGTVLSRVARTKGP